ncbi:DNA-N1-methyladenine dioxygenase [Pedobacter caeni]|uniref:DNA-N1-methyladenine dioxygenase n=2 Tax=Pedobacter caeni TaxID=288992 RepID=A0A1M5AFS4_9SPHI|nr:DNA-N1-methyladenine dioxygenase [Pedobacter caeni]
MEQLSFFKEEGQTPGLPVSLLDYRAEFFEAGEGKALMERLIKDSLWKQRVVKMYDKEVVTPRLTAWYGDPEAYNYTVLGKSAPLPRTADLLMIRKKVELIAGISFNSVLLNYYRDGNDSVAWHSDNEKALGTHPVIASVTFGQVRSFDIRNKADHSLKYSIRLEHGSLMIMKGDLQVNWNHRIAKSTKPMTERLNLTFRVVI